MRQYGWVVEIEPGEQVEKCKRAVGMNRKIQNRLLEHIKEEEARTGEYLPKSFSGLRQIYMDNRSEWFVDEESGEEYWSEVHKEVGPEAARRLSLSFKNFFDSCKGKRGGRRSGYPRFRKMGKSDSTRYTTGFSQPKERSVMIPKIGWIPMKESVDWEGKKVSSLTLKTKAGRWFVSFTITEEDWEYPEKKKPAVFVGIDIGVGDRAITLSTGEIVPNPRFYRNGEAKLRRLQRSASRKQKNSNNKNKTQRKVQLQHMRIANGRKDFLHKLTTSLVNNHDVICIEDLNVAGMKQGLSLGKSVSDVSPGEFRRMLYYKCAWYGTTLYVADRWFPSSQLCSECGLQNKDTKQLGIRVWDCPECGTHHDRDLNASINLEINGWTVLQTQTAESSRPLPETPVSGKSGLRNSKDEDVSNVLIS